MPMIRDAIMQTHTNLSPGDVCHQIVSLLQYGFAVTRHINTGSIAPHSHWQLRCVTNELQSVCPSDIALSYYRITFSNLHVCLSMEFMAEEQRRTDRKKILVLEFEATWRVKCGKLQENKRDLARPHNFLHSRICYRRLSTFYECISMPFQNRARWGSNGTAFDLQSGGPRHGIPSNLRFILIF